MFCSNGISIASVLISLLIVKSSYSDLIPNSTFTEITASNYDLPREFFFIFSGLAIGGILRGLIKVINIPIPIRVLVLLFGIFLGAISSISKAVDDYTSIKNMSPTYISASFFPLIFYKTSFCIDNHTFVRSWAQIFVLGVFGICLNACFVGGIMMLLIADGWHYIVGVFFGVVCSGVYPAEIVTMLKEIGKAKHLSILLEGEMMIGDGTVIIIFHILFGIIENYVTTWYHIIMLFLRFSIGGIILGFLIGKLTKVFMTTYTDSVNVLIMTIVSAYLTYYIGEVMLSVSGVIAVVTLGVMASSEKSSLSANSELFVTQFWEMLGYIANTMVFLIAGVIIPNQLRDYFTLENVALIIVMYVVVNVARFCAFMLLAPILSRLGYGLTFRNMIIAVWSGLRGPVPFCLTFLLLSNTALQEVGKKMLLYITALSILTLLINATTMPAFLKLLGLSQLSTVRSANMNNCMRYLQNRRDRAISMLKMNRFLGDANWPLVHKSTMLKHPYKINYPETDDEEEDNYLGYRLTVCPDCQKMIPNQPTAKEMIEMTREARMRILKAKKISYSRQYEKGMMSKESIRVLTQAVETAMDTEEAIIELEGLHRLFRRQGYPHYIRKKLLLIFFRKNETDIKPPRKYWRRICYHIVMHPAFEIFINCAILVNCIPIGLEIGLKPHSHSMLSTNLKIANTFFFLIYFFEFAMKVYGYSWVYICKDGFKTYFSYYWNIFDFTILIFALADLMLDYYDLFSKNFEKTDFVASKITLITKLLRVLRLIRLVRLCKAWYPTLIKYCDSKIDKHLAFAYDVGKGFVTGEEEVSDKLIQMIDNKTIREECHLQMEADRLAITKELGLIQKDRPWIAITVKTKQAIRSTLNSMVDAAMELKVSGWVDDVEYGMIMESLERRLKFAHTKIKSVQPIPPRVLFKEVSWMSEDEQLSDYLYDHVITKIFDQGDVVCTDGQLSEGVYIIVTGLFKLLYEPQPLVLNSLKQYGMLPIIDYITSMRFDEKIEDYIVSGNSIGELSVLTGRPYNCTIIADTASQAYILTHEVIKEAFKRSQDPVNGIESKMWKAISIRLATSILMDTAAYQSSTQEQIHFELERSFVPSLSRYKIFGVNEMMEDIVLIEGLAVDFNTREFYAAPCYIPRTVQKIILPKSSNINLDVNIDTKLLIIPAKDVDEFDIMEKEEDISEMVSTASSKCLQHKIQSKTSAFRYKRKRPTVFGFNNRRVKYLKSTSLLENQRSRMDYSSSNVSGESVLMQSIDMNPTAENQDSFEVDNERARSFDHKERRRSSQRKHSGMSRLSARIPKTKDVQASNFLFAKPKDKKGESNKENRSSQNKDKLPDSKDKGVNRPLSMQPENKNKSEQVSLSDVVDKDLAAAVLLPKSSKSSEEESKRVPYSSLSDFSALNRNLIANERSTETPTYKVNKDSEMVSTFPKVMDTTKDDTSELSDNRPSPKKNVEAYEDNIPKSKAVGNDKQGNDEKENIKVVKRKSKKETRSDGTSTSSAPDGNRKENDPRKVSDNSETTQKEVITKITNRSSDSSSVSKKDKPKK